MSPAPADVARPLADVYDAVFLDLDGVLYVGPDAVPGASEVVTELHRRGVPVAYVTNNASRTPQMVAEHLTELGIPAGPAEVVTSAQAVATLVAGRVPAGAPVLVIGGDGLHQAIADRGLQPVSTADAGPAAVVQGFGPDVGWRLLAEGSYAVRAGVPWFASNLDATVPTAGGLAPGNGALVDVIASATGSRPLAVAGKPETPLHEEAVRRTGARNPLMVGDRLDTDIEGANRAGADSLLVLTGVSTAGDLLVAPAEQRPTFVAADLRAGLLATLPALTPVPGGWRCGGWTCREDPTDLDGPAVSGSGEWTDGLRALCATVWARGRLPTAEESVRYVARLTASNAA